MKREGEWIAVLGYPQNQLFGPGDVVLASTNQTFLGATMIVRWDSDSADMLAHIYHTVSSFLESWQPAVVFDAREPENVAPGSSGVSQEVQFATHGSLVPLLDRHGLYLKPHPRRFEPTWHSAIFAVIYVSQETVILALDVYRGSMEKEKWDTALRRGYGYPNDFAYVQLGVVQDRFSDADLRKAKSLVRISLQPSMRCAL